MISFLMKEKAFLERQVWDSHWQSHGLEVILCFGLSWRQTQSLSPLPPSLSSLFIFDIHPSLGMLFWEALAFLTLSLKLPSLLCGCLSVMWLFENVMLFFLLWFLLRLFLNFFTSDTENPKSRPPSSSVTRGTQDEDLEIFCYRFVSYLIWFSSLWLLGY